MWKMLQIHLGYCLKGTKECYKCCQEGHFQRDYPKWANKAQPLVLIPLVRENLKGATSSISEAIDQLCAMVVAQMRKKLQDIVTGIIQILTLNCYVSIDLGSTH